MEALEILSHVLSSVWHFFTDLTVPGIEISFGAWFLAGFLIEISIALVQYTFGFGGSKGSGYRSGQSGKKHISKERKDDET